MGEASVMERTEAAAAWRYFGLNWIPIGLIGAALAAGVALSEFSLELGGLSCSLAFVAVYAGFGYATARAPAVGVYQQIGLDPTTLTSLDPRAYLDQVRDLAPVREGTLRHLDLFSLAGIVTFPSFHAASALLYAWALWPVRWIRPVAIIANAAMLASTPIDGGHYFVDLIAGAAIAAASIAAARWSGRVLLGQSPASETARLS